MNPVREEIVFNNARKLYPGTKRGDATEFGNFKKKHRDWKEALPLLKPAIEKQMRWRVTAKSSEFRPEWKHLQTWINQRSWEDELAGEDDRDCFICGAPYVEGGHKWGTRHPRTGKK